MALNTQNTPRVAAYGDASTLSLIYGNDDARLVFCKDSYGVLLNSFASRLPWAIASAARNWSSGVTAVLLPSLAAGADDAYEFNNSKLANQNALVQFQVNIDGTDGGATWDFPGLWMGNTDNLHRQFSSDGGTTSQFALDTQNGSTVAFSDAAVLSAGVAQNEYYRVFINADNEAEWDTTRNHLFPNDENLGVRGLFLHPSTGGGTDNNLRTFADVSTVDATSNLAGGINDWGFAFRGAATGVWRQDQGGTLNAVNSGLPTYGKVNSLFGTGDKATDHGDLIVEKANNQYAWAIRHNSATISAGDWMPAYCGSLVYRLNGTARVPGKYISVFAENSVSYGDWGRGTSTGASGVGLKGMSDAEIQNWLWHSSLDLDQPIVFLIGPAEENTDEATIKEAADTFYNAATTIGCTDVRIAFITNFMHLESATSESVMRARIEQDRDHKRAVVDTYIGLGRRACLISIYDQLNGHLYNGTADAREALASRGADAFVRPDGTTVDLTDSGGWNGDLLDANDLHIGSNSGGGVLDNNAAGEFYAEAFFSAIESGLGGGRSRTRTRAR